MLTRVWFFDRLAGFAAAIAIAGVVSIQSTARGQFDGPGPLPPDPAAAPIDADPGAVEVLASGPIHEAFGAPVLLDAKPSPIIPKEPPQAIDELPPEQQPDGKNVEWIPGYWHFDEQRGDFIWISGVWREIPPGRRWVPGYWSQVEGGWQWVSGLWTPVAQQEVEYLPEPPVSVEQGPVSPAPSDDHFWVPGSWVRRDARYMWRPGFWTPQYVNWVWVPQCYSWTPYGYVYGGGYWDYDPIDRGLCFAPVYYRRPVYLTAGYYYRPSIFFDTGLFSAHLFIHSGYRHYYFGNYYDRVGVSVGFYPWHDFHRHRGFYDPFYTYYRWNNVHRHHHRDWEDNLRRDYARYRDHRDQRPSRSFAAQQRSFERSSDRQRLAYRLDDAANVRNGSVRLRNADLGDRDRVRAQVNQWRQLERQRGDAERRDRPRGAGENNVAARRTFQLPDSRTIGRNSAPRGDGDRPGNRSGDGDRNSGRRSITGAENRDGGSPGLDAARRGSRGEPTDRTPRVEGQGRRDVARPTPRRDEGAPSTRRETTPTPRGDANPSPRRDATPGARRENPGRPPRTESGNPPRREITPSPRREITPRRESAPTPRREITPTPRREASPAPRRENSPAPRREFTPSPRRDSTPSPRREVAPSPRRESAPAPRREFTPAPRRDVSPAPRRETAPSRPPRIERPSQQPRPSRDGPSRGGRGPRAESSQRTDRAESPRSVRTPSQRSTTPSFNRSVPPRASTPSPRVQRPAPSRSTAPRVQRPTPAPSRSAAPRVQRPTPSRSAAPRSGSPRSSFTPSPRSSRQASPPSRSTPRRSTPPSRGSSSGRGRRPR